MGLLAFRQVLSTFVFIFILNDAWGQVSLYGTQDGILLLDGNNFAQQVYNQRKAFLVEFYSHYCPHCVDYAPEFKRFAARLQSWSPIIQIGAVDCENLVNSKLCRDHDIEVFPTLKYFKFYSRWQYDGQQFNGDRSADTLPNEVANMVFEDWAKQVPPEWPNFNFVYDNVTLDMLWSTLNASTPYLAVIVGSQPAKLAYAEMINYAFDTRVLVVSVTSSNTIARRMMAGQSVSLPKVYLFTKNNPNPIYISRNFAYFGEITDGMNAQINGQRTSRRR